MECSIDITDEVLGKLMLIMNASKKVIRTFLKEYDLFIEAELQTMIVLRDFNSKYIPFNLIQFQTGDMFQLRERVLVNKEFLKFKHLFLQNPENYTVRKKGSQIFIDVESKAKFLEEV